MSKQQSLNRVKEQILPINIENNHRIYGLDILRAAAILLVLFLHSFQMLPAGAIKYYLSYFLFDGVSIFFVLSGYLIGGIIIRDFDKGFTLKRLFKFWKNRWLRTLPAYYLVLIICTGLALVTHPNFSLPKRFLIIFSFRLFNYPSPSFLMKLGAFR